MSEEPLSLGQLIWLVRRELEWAHAVDADHPLRFDVDSIELDVAVEAGHSVVGKAGLEIKVMSIGGGGDVSRENKKGSTTNIHVVLTPRDLNSSTGRFNVSAMDTEPPPRWPDALHDTPTALGAEETLSVNGAPLSATDTEPVPHN